MKMAVSRRDVNTKLWYMRPDCPKLDVVASKFGTFKDVVQMPLNFLKHRDEYYEKHPMTVVDGRTHLPGGKEAWSFEEHGFCYIKTPDYEFEDHLQQDRRRANREFGPKVAEAVRQATGAKRAFWLSHQRRAEVGTPTEGYARGAGHSDYGPENEAQCRRMLTARCGVPQDEAQSCGLCLVNLWCPVERPAYKFPLALLDSSTVDPEKEWIRQISHPDADNGYGYYNNKDTAKSLSGAQYSTGENTVPSELPDEERTMTSSATSPAEIPLTHTLSLSL